ncbi:MAG TPA: HAD family phosphatase [Bacteroidia bacterium]
MQIEASVKNIIFDFGGVILNIDNKLAEKSFERLGLKKFDQLYSQAAQKELFDELETGLISPDMFRKKIRNYISSDVSDLQIDNAWNSMLLDLPEERIELLEKLKPKYRLFLLSNTNEIHFAKFSAYMRNKFRRDLFSGLFEKAYLSFEVKMRKPNVAIFEHVLNQSGLKGDETLFIDDSFQHIEGAKKVGLRAVFLEKGKTILDVFT